MVCDLAQYYHVVDYQSLGAFRLRTLVFGLPREARLIKKISGQRVGLDTMLLAGILDRLSVVLYRFSSSKASRPEMVTDKLAGGSDKKKGGIFASGKDYEKRKEELLCMLGGGDGR